jgi:thiol-disulfide isomerase/thioredoxin
MLRQAIAARTIVSDGSFEIMRGIMKTNIRFLIAATLIWSMPALAVDQGDEAPKWQAISFQDKAVSFPELSEGRPTVMIFWASWCDYCAAFMPYLKKIQEDYGTDRISIVAVNAKEKDGDPEAYVKKFDFPVTAIRNGDEIAAAYGVKFIPGLMVVNGGGTVSYRRGWTELPAGKTVAQLWSDQVRTALDQAL